MATLSTNNPTLLDVATRSDPDGKIAVVAEILNETNEMLMDAVWIEGNLPTGHRTTVRTGIPAPTWRRLYGGVQPTKSTTAQITDATGMLEAYAEVDKALADLNGNTSEFRLSEDRPHVEGMSQEAATTMIFGDEAINQDRFTGLAPRYNTVNPANAQNADNVIDAGGTGSDNASIWLVGWGPNTVHGIYPKGSQAGLMMQDLGEVTIENQDGNGGRMQAYRSHYRWDLGLTVRDWRYCVRIANIDRSELTPDASTGADLNSLMFQAQERIPNLASARFAWYMDRTIITVLRQQTAAAVRNSTLTTEMVGGVMVTNFNGMPVRRVDALAVNEAQVV